MNHTIYEHLTYYPTGKILPTYKPLTINIMEYKAPADRIIHNNMREYKIELKVESKALISEEFLDDAFNAESYIRAQGFEQIKHHLYKDGLNLFRQLELAVFRDDKESVLFLLHELENEVLGCS